MSVEEPTARSDIKPPRAASSRWAERIVRLRLAVAELAFEPASLDRPRRLRRAAYGLAALGCFGLAGAAAAGSSTAVLLAADPFRLISRPLAESDAARREHAAAIRGHIRAIEALQDRMAALEGRIGVVERAGAAHAALADGRARLAVLAGEQAARLRAKEDLASARTQAEAAAKEAEGAAAAAMKAFAIRLSEALQAQISTDAERAAALEADAAAPGLLARRAAFLAQARGPLRDLRAAVDLAADFQTAAALAEQLAAIAQAMAPIRAPLRQAEELAQARADFTRVDAEIRTELAELRAVAEDRPWPFAPAARKAAWREAQARWSALAPLVEELDALQAQVFASGSPDVAAAAARRAQALATDIRTRAAAPPPPSETRSPAALEREQALRMRLAEAYSSAETTYADVFNAARPLIDRNYRRRRDREAAEELRAALSEMHQALRAMDRLVQSKGEAEEERALEAALDEARLLLRGLDEEARRARRALRALD